MNAIFVNDTSGTSNPGCQGTVFHLMKGLHGRSINVLSRLPVCYGYNLFSGCLKTRPHSTREKITRRLNRVRGVIPKLEPVQFLDHAAWTDAVSSLEKRLSPGWREVDLVVVNGEGTIHHDSVGALTLAGICTAAKRMGKTVVLVNCSISDVGDWLLEALRISVDYFSVREPVSLRYLQARGISAVQSADCLFLASEPDHQQANARRVDLHLKKPYVIYTPGVLSGCNRVSEMAIAEDIKAIVRFGRNVVYYVVETEDERFSACAASAGAVVLPLGSLRWNELQGVIGGADWVVSGRYHINIFAALAATPFVPLETNTSKMHGLLELLRNGEPFTVRSWNDLGSDEVSRRSIGLDAAITVSASTIKNCATLARLSFGFALDSKVRCSEVKQHA